MEAYEYEQLLKARGDEIVNLREQLAEQSVQHYEMHKNLRARLAETERQLEEEARLCCELQDAIDSRDKAAGFEEVTALSPEARQAFRAAVQEIDGVNLREVERLRGLLQECEPAIYAQHMDTFGTRIAKPATLLARVRAALKENAT